MTKKQIDTLLETVAKQTAQIEELTNVNAQLAATRTNRQILSISELSGLGRDLPNAGTTTEKGTLRPSRSYTLLIEGKLWDITTWLTKNGGYSCTVKPATNPDGSPRDYVVKEAVASAA